MTHDLQTRVQLARGQTSACNRLPCRVAPSASSHTCILTSAPSARRLRLHRHERRTQLPGHNFPVAEDDGAASWPPQLRHQLMGATRPSHRRSTPTTHRYPPAAPCWQHFHSERRCSVPRSPGLPADPPGARAHTGVLSARQSRMAQLSRWCLHFPVGDMCCPDALELALPSCTRDPRSGERCRGHQNRTQTCAAALWEARL